MESSYAFPGWMKRSLFITKLFFLSIIFFGCERSLNKVEREKVKDFFQELLLEHGAAYTLFGSKPLTVEDLIEFSKEERVELEQYLAAHPEIEYILIDRKLEEGWEEWKKIQSHYLSKNYILTEVELASSRTLVFLNVPLTISTLKQHYVDFKEVVGCDFDPAELVEQLRENKEGLWSKILLNYKTLGILAGYGYQNAKIFENQFKSKQGICHPSENNDPRLKAECYLDNKPFRIPIFVMLDENESRALVAKYKEEREQIKKRYLGRDFLDVTLAQLKLVEDKNSAKKRP
jgi:hypothetical protein